MSACLLTNFEIQRHLPKEPRFNGVCSKNNLSKIKDVAYVINPVGYKSIETHWIALCVNGDNVRDIASFEVAYIPKEIKKLIGSKNITTNVVYRMQAYDSVMDTSVLDLLILCLIIKDWQILLT